MTHQSHSAGNDPPLLFLKSTTRRRVFVPTYTRGDGTVVEGHYAMVHVSADHDDARVMAGQGSYSQRQAHTRLSREEWFSRLPADHKIPVLLHHATAIQDAASASAAVSGWRARAHAGQNPTQAQWRAFHALPAHRQYEIAHAAIVARGNGDHLRAPHREERQEPHNPRPPESGSTQPQSAPDPAPATESANRPQRVVAAAEVTQERPAPHENRSHAVRAMLAVRVPRFTGTDPECVSARRQALELRALASGGHVDAIVNYATMRVGIRSTRLDNYRLALLAAAQHLTPAQASASVRSPLPEPPDITGANMQNTALLAARRKVQFLHVAAQSADPVAAIMAIPTSRGNRYLNAADDYKRALLAHFGVDVAGTPVEGVVPAQPMQVQQPPVTPASAEPVRARARVRRIRPTPAAGPVPDSQNPDVAANHLGLSEAELGFVPRPNVPLDQRTNAPGYTHPDSRVMTLNRRYLAQSSNLQSRAREYQARRWWPDTAAGRKGREHLERVQQQQQRRHEAAQMQAMREAAARVEAKMDDMDALFTPRNRVGANIESLPQLSPETRAVIWNVLRVPPDKGLELLSGMVADYDSPGKFTMKVTPDGTTRLEVRFQKADGTRITRLFRRNDSGSLTVSHSYFKAGRTGQGSGKHLFRVSMGIYKALGVKHVTVYANIDVGGYAWARFGYQTTEWSTLRSTLLSRLDQLASGSFRDTSQGSASGNARSTQRTGGLTNEEREAVRAVLNFPSNKALWAVADMRLGERAIGKELLLGTNWQGTMSLSDPAVMRRFMKYVNPSSD
jgi:hypothetical protein